MSNSIENLKNDTQKNKLQRSAFSEVTELSNKIKNCQLPIQLMERTLRSVERLERMAQHGSYSGDFETVSKYIDWITQIPWNKTTQDNLDITHAKQLMDKTHYGMDTVKNLILDYLAVMQLKKKQAEKRIANGVVTQQPQKASLGRQKLNSEPTQVEPTQAEQGSLEQKQSQTNMAILRGSSANAPVMIFVGLQGVGKTSIAKSIAGGMGRKFVRISVGAIGSVQMLRGTSRALPDAEPGQIIKALIRTKSMNPIILLDEIDKVSGNKALLSDVMAALLEILDPEQNSTFVDHYIDYPVDLSQVFFICTANNLGSISTALLDRMEVIRFTSYSDEEKEIIAKNYSLPKVLKNTGVPEDSLVIKEDVWPQLVRPVGFDAGLRQLERNLATLVRKVARRIIEGANLPIIVTTENLREFVLPDQGPLS